MRLEAPNHLPALSNDAYVAIITAKEEAVGSGADAGDLVALEEAARLVVGGVGLGDLEEVEGLPLSRESGMLAEDPCEEGFRESENLQK